MPILDKHLRYEDDPVEKSFTTLEYLKELKSRQQDKYGFPHLKKMNDQKLLNYARGRTFSYVLPKVSEAPTLPDRQFINPLDYDTDEDDDINSLVSFDGISDHEDEQSLPETWDDAEITISSSIYVTDSSSDTEVENISVTPEAHTLLETYTTNEEQKRVSIRRFLTVAAAKKPAEKWIMHYCSSHKILTVGDGDFSFSACLAKAFGFADNMHATSLNDHGFLVKNYKNSIENIYELQSRGSTVIHCVDATEMADHYLLGNLKFDRIVFNFPLAGFFRDESRQSQISRNQELVLAFLFNAKKMIKKDGEIHISHKSMGFFLQWNLKFLARRCGLRLKEEVEFDLDDYPGYQNKYGYGGDKNFNCNPSKTYKFALQCQSIECIFDWRE